MEAMEKEILGYEAQIDGLIWNIPNMLDKSVPIGIPPEANKTLKNWGTA